MADTAFRDEVETRLTDAETRIEQTIAALEAEVERLRMCYATATGKLGCGKGDVLRIECKQMTALRAEIERLRKIEVAAREYLRVKKSWDNRLPQLQRLKAALESLSKSDNTSCETQKMPGATP